MERDTDLASPTVLSTRAGVVGRPLLEELEQYWRDLRGARRLPVRTEVNPAQIDAILPYSFILERVGPGLGRLRIAGQSLNNLLGMEARGMPLSVFFAPDARAVLAEYLERVFERPALVELPLLSPRMLTRGRLTGRMLILPLLGSDGTVSRALGAIMTDGTQGRGGRQFEIPPDGLIRVETLDTVARVGMRAVGGNGAVVPMPVRDRAHLRLVVSN